MKKLLNTLYVTLPDAYLLLKGETVVLQLDKKEIGRIPLHNLEQIVIFGYHGVSPMLMGKCVSKQIGLVFMNPYGKFLARIEGGVSGNVLLRREQYRIADNENRSINIARNIIVGKIYNSRQLLMRSLRDHALVINEDKVRQKTIYMKESLSKSQAINNHEELRGIEGEVASLYFSVFQELILQQKEEFVFHGRSRRPPKDRVNALLSFVYSLCTSMCTSALESVGLDPYVGFLHTDRPGRRSLALDLVEEFRTWMCDRFTLTLINKKIVNVSDFDIREDGAVLLNEKGRKEVLTIWQNKKTEVIKHPFLKEKIEWGMLPYVQALLLARYIRGDLDEYPPFMWK